MDTWMDNSGPPVISLSVDPLLAKRHRFVVRTARPFGPCSGVVCTENSTIGWQFRLGLPRLSK